MTVKLEAQIEALVRKYEGRVEAGLAKGLALWGYLAAAKTQRLVQKGPKTGRIYKRRSVTHQASAPGEPPASDTGRLVGLISSQMGSDGKSVRIVAGVKYAEMLEFGTSRMQPRPFFRRGVRETTELGLKIIKDEIEKEMRR